MNSLIAASTVFALAIVFAAPSTASAFSFSPAVVGLAEEYRQGLEDLADELDVAVDDPSLEAFASLGGDFKTVLGSLEASYSALVSSEHLHVLTSHIVLEGIEVRFLSDEFFDGVEVLTLKSVQPWAGNLTGTITNRATLVNLPSGAGFGLAVAKFTGVIDGMSVSWTMMDAAYFDETSAFHPGVWTAMKGDLKQTVAVVSFEHPPVAVIDRMDFVMAGRVPAS